MLQKIISIILLGIILPVWGANPQLETAIAQGQWPTVIRLLRNRQDTVSLLIRGEARRILGYLDAAHHDHERAWNQAETSKLKIWAGRTSAETMLAMHKYNKGTPNAQQRLEAIPKGCEMAECAKIEFLQGRLHAALGNFDDAIASYQTAGNNAQTAGLRVLSIQAQLAIIDIEQTATPETLDAVVQELQQVRPIYIQTALRLGLAKRTYEMGNLQVTQRLLNQVAPNVAPGYQKAEFLSLQAKVLKDNGQNAQALHVVSKAIKEARRIQAGNLLMYGEWERARLYKALNDNRRSLAAFRRALYHLETIRTDIPIEYRDGKSSFRETLAPLYLETADLMLAEAASRSEDAAQPLLFEARDIVERLKAAELQDYLGESCPLSTKPITNIEAISPRTGVLYPIILPDRLVLLLGMGNRQHQTVVSVENQIFSTEARELGAQLREMPDDGVPPPKELANKLFGWLIAPIKARLDAANIDTLVVVPDGPLRLFPFSALMDGDTFLVEQYAVVTAPSLTLMEPKPLARSNITAVVAGMSRPGPVVDEFLQMQMAAGGEDEVRGFVANNNKNRSRRIRGLAIKPRKPKKSRAGTSPIPPTQTIDPELRESTIEQLALPGVDKEVARVSKIFGVTPLVNKQFTLNSFSQNLKQNSWNIVHVATHGYFGGTPETSFFMTYDRFLKVRRLETVIAGNVNNAPPELLTLSACQTAEGNDRAPLGIVGIAIKSGARSALGSLWPVSDDATQLLISQFYQNLVSTDQTKAQAFRKAQIKVLNQKEFHHPYYWSPFILIGNWL